MFDSELQLNLALMSLCYTYILAVIFISERMVKLKISRRFSRKFLHAMIGNLSFIIPFFTYNTFPLNFPFFVAAPFIILTFLALFLASKPHVMAVGVLPMAYGDAVASAVGERWGRRRYKILSGKSLEGSAAMLLVTFTSLMISTAYFSMFNTALSITNQALAHLIAAVVASIVEGSSPSGFDNLSVPLSTVLVYLSLSGGF